MALAVEEVGSMENRRHARVGARMRCWCEGDNVTLYSRVENLSEGGLFLRTSTPLKAGTRATVRLGPREESGPALQTEVKVVWARQTGHIWPPGMGLQFERLGAAELDQLRQIISHERTRWPGA